MRVIIEPHTIGVFPYVKSLAKYTTVRKSPALGKFYTYKILLWRVTKQWHQQNGRIGNSCLPTETSKNKQK